MPSKPKNEQLLANAREDQGHMPGHLVITTIVYAAFAYVALTYAPDAGASKYFLYVLVVLPLAAPAGALFVQWAVVIARRLGARLLVRQARRTFRASLKAARIHPELVDLDRLRRAAAALSHVAPVDALRAAPEVAAAAEHPYAPIRSAGLSVMEATGAARREARSGPTG